jgi:hypothetical protein
MAGRKPYDEIRVEEGRAYFVAELPAFALIGQRFDEISKAYYSTGSAVASTTQRGASKSELALAVKAAVERVRQGRQDWRTVEADLEKQFGDQYWDLKFGVIIALSGKHSLTYPQARESYEKIIATKPGLENFLVTLANHAHIMLAASNPAQPLGLPGNALKIFEQLAERMGRAGHGLPSPQKLMEERMKAIQQQMKGLPPAAARQLEEHMAQMEQFFKDPSALFGAAAHAGGEAEESESGDADSENEQCERLPAGQFRFETARGKEFTQRQKELFDWLAANQAQVAKEVKGTLATMFEQMAEGVDREDPTERVLCPESASPDTALDRFRISAFILDRTDRRIGLQLESLFYHYDEHGCAILVEDGKVTDYGEWDAIEVLYR